MKILSPYENTFRRPWFKGDLHIHSDASDGHASWPRIRERLLECGFSFAALADHDRYSPPDADSELVRIGNSEMRSVEGGEVLTLFAEVQADPRAGVQDLIDRTRQAGGMPVLAHPRIGEFGLTKHHVSYPDHALIGTYRHYRGIEVYTHNVGSGFQTAIERLDSLWLARCSAADDPIAVWGFAASDAHDLTAIKPDVGILVAAENRDPVSLRTAIEAGRFYALADSAARFTAISVSGATLRVSAEKAKLLRLYGGPQRGIPGDRRLLAVAWADAGEFVTLDYTVRGTEGFVRAEAADRNGAFIYANPLRILNPESRR